MNVYQPAEWHDFFLTVAGGAAALTGLVVVAMSIHLDVIAADAALRHRARMVLFGLAGAFVLSALVLMGGQGLRAVAVEVFAIGLIGAVGAMASFAGVVRTRRPMPGGFVFRSLTNIGLYLVEMLGAVVLFAGSGTGLYLIGLAIMANISLMITGAWHLLIGISQDEAAAEGARPG